LRALGQRRLQPEGGGAAAAARGMSANPADVQTALGTPTASAVAFFLVVVALTLAITWWAARRTRSTKEFYAAGRSVSAFQNGLALPRDSLRPASLPALPR